MLRKSLWLIVVAMTAGCTNPGVKNSAAFATSLNELTKSEVLSNLRRVYDEGATFVPSHVVVSTGRSTTSVSVSPSFTLPLGPGYSNTFTPTGNGQFSGQTSFGAPVLSLGGNGTMSQEWDMTPATDVDALMRLRTLYLYVADQMVEKSDEELKKLKHQFLCNYPVQRHPVTTLDDGATDKNIAYRLTCKDKPESIFYADLNFVTNPDCIVCINISYGDVAARQKRAAEAALAAKQNKPDPATPVIFEVHISDRLKPGIVFCAKSIFAPCEHAKTPESGDIDLSHHLAAGQSQREVLPELPRIGLQASTEVYLRKDFKDAFRDFILFTSSAMAPATPLAAAKSAASN